MNWPMIVTAYTRGTQYATMATRLTSSAMRWGLSVTAIAYDPSPSWRHNVNVKRTIIKEAVQKYGAVLWVDADGEIVALPTPAADALEMGVSFAAYNQKGLVRQGLRIHGGSLYFAGEGGLKLLRAMELYAQQFPEHPEQLCLDNLVGALLEDSTIERTPGWGGVLWWPQGMCKIREHEWVAGEKPEELIRQYQGSRTGRTDVAAASTRKQ